MKIGNVFIEKSVGLAPMASVADTTYRLMAKKFGTAYMTGEMVSAKGLCYNSAKSKELLTVTDAERPMAVQLFGNEPDVMAKAAKLAAEYRPDVIDINMGCPVPKVAGNGSGSALMKTPQLAADIVYSVADAVNIPVTVKIRKGWDENNVNAVEFAKLMEKSGCKAITVHGRFKNQMYSGKSDNKIITAVKSEVNVPVIGNGDITNAETALKMYEETKCDFIVLGRASYGNPWIFREIKSFLDNGSVLSKPCFNEIIEVMLEHAGLACSIEGEKIVMREFRKHAAWYLKGFHNAAKLRNKCFQIETYEDLKEIVKSII